MMVRTLLLSLLLGSEAALRRGPSEQVKACDDKTVSDLQAKVAKLELENKQLRAKVIELESPALVAQAPTQAMQFANSTGTVDAIGWAREMAVASTNSSKKYFPVPDMPSPFPGQTFLPELNMAPVDGALRHTSVAGSNAFGVPMAASTINLGPGKTLTYDDIVFGYNCLWADLGLWKMQRYKGLRFFQAPQDAIAIQQMIWAVQPDLIIEIGTHGGGSAVYFSDIMKSYNPAAMVVTMDPDDSNIDLNGLFYKTPTIKYLKGPSNDPVIFQQVTAMAAGKQKVMVIQDGMHSYDGVMADLAQYNGLVSVGSYFVVQDTTLDRAWPSPFNGAMRATKEFTAPGGKGYGRFGIDKAYEYLLFSTNHNGYLKKVNI